MPAFNGKVAMKVEHLQACNYGLFVVILKVIPVQRLAWGLACVLAV